MFRFKLAFIAGPAAALLAACGSSGTTAQTTSTPPAEITPRATASPTPVTIDPCQLVTSGEASQLAGVSFATGREETTPDNGGRTCVYGYQTRNVFTVVVNVAPDAATAQADWSQAEAQAQTYLQQIVSQAGGPAIQVSVSDVSITGADKAAVGTFAEPINGVTIAGSAVYALKGKIFFTFSDLLLGAAPPSTSSMQAQAAIVIGRLP